MGKSGHFYFGMTNAWILAAIWLGSAYKRHRRMPRPFEAKMRLESRSLAIWSGVAVACNDGEIRAQIPRASQADVPGCPEMSRLEKMTR